MSRMRLEPAAFPFQYGERGSPVARGVRHEPRGTGIDRLQRIGSAVDMVRDAAGDGITIGVVKGIDLIAPAVIEPVLKREIGASRAAPIIELDLRPRNDLCAGHAVPGERLWAEDRIENEGDARDDQ